MESEKRFFEYCKAGYEMISNAIGMLASTHLRV
jgi:hypothetical protein